MTEREFITNVKPKRKNKLLIYAAFIMAVVLVFNTIRLNVIKKLIDSKTVSIVTESQFSYGICTGVIIENKDGYAEVLTAKHCGLSSDTVVDQYNIKSFIVSDLDDIALIILDTKIQNKTKADIFNGQLSIDDELYHVGYPALDMYFKHGKVRRILNSIILTDVEIISGCSGGGFFNKNGELVGIGIASIDAWKKSLIEPIKDINRFLYTTER